MKKRRMAMDELTIRWMTVEDIDEVMTVEHTSFSSPWKKEDILHDLVENPFSDYLVVEKNNQVIGYCGAWTVVESAQITNIAILPSERGNRYGERLFNRMIRWLKLKDAKELSLEVRESNVAAQRLYERFGMKAVGKRKNYYRDNGEDAIVMWVELS